MMLSRDTLAKGENGGPREENRSPSNSHYTQQNHLLLSLSLCPSTVDGEYMTNLPGLKWNAG